MTRPSFLNTRRALLAAACLAIAAPTMAADAWPTKPVKLIVPYPPGGPVDGVARGLAERLSKLWNQPVLVDNRGGANEIIAADMTAKSVPDGHTIILGHVGSLHRIIRAVNALPSAPRSPSPPTAIADPDHLV